LLDRGDELDRALDIVDDRSFGNLEAQRTHIDIAIDEALTQEFVECR
jgi:hypothetical protein